MHAEEREQLINDYLDDALSDSETHHVEQLLQLDAVFAAEVERHRALLAQVARLPRQLSPPAEAWEEIRRRIDAGKVVAADFGKQPERAAWWRYGALAAAAVALIALSSTVTMLMLRPSDPVPASATPAMVFAGVESVEANYAPTLETLRMALDERRDFLAAETIAIIESTLDVIDQAIRDATRALESDPANRMVYRQLAGAYERKVQILTRAAQMPAQM
jgi:anti-sigma-K factor RskA